MSSLPRLKEYRAKQAFSAAGERFLEGDIVPPSAALIAALALGTMFVEPVRREGEESLEDLSHAALKEHARALGIEFHGNISKPDLISLVELQASTVPPTPPAPVGESDTPT